MTAETPNGRTVTFTTLVLSAALASACNARTPLPDAAQVTPSANAAKESPPARLPPGPAALKLATWNLEWLNAEPGKGPVKRSEEDYSRLRKYAERLDADVVALQEVDGEAAAARVFPSDVYELHVAQQTTAQRTGFAVRKTLPMRRHADYLDLDVGGVRAAADIAVALGPHAVRLLSVHLKSGCFDQPLDGRSNACRKLGLQLPKLEAWIDARATEGAPFALLGDFNRRLFQVPDEPFWKELDDATPPEADLAAPTEGQKPRCWDQEYAQFIDHIVLSKSGHALVKVGSFTQHLYDASDEQRKSVLSDHCPLSVVLVASGGNEPGNDAGTASAGDAGANTAADASTADAASMPSRAADGGPGDIKGNIGSRGKKLYHLPSCPNYASVKIDADKGERMFATETEAKAAGWEKASDCR
jgi:endonuclease/exonuclease/phosphatase family metal-dependent hydrolase